MAIKGAALDARLQYGLLLDPKLNKDLSGDEFRTFMRLLVWSVSLVSDGAFHVDDARMIADREDIDRLTEVGVLECDHESGWHRIHLDYQSWQSSKAELDKLEAKRAADRNRKRKESEEQPMQPQQPF